MVFKDNCNGIGNASVFYNETGMYHPIFTSDNFLFLNTFDAEKVVERLRTLQASELNAVTEILNALSAFAFLSTVLFLFC